jgi:hypothetical protein
MSAHLERLVREWREAQKDIDALEKHYNPTVGQRSDALDRLVAAHNALIKYVDEEME